MDTARAADLADPHRNAQFSRRWTGPPPQKRVRPPAANQGALLGIIGNGNSGIDRTSRRAAQRAILHATRRVAQLQRRADLLATIGLTDASLRLASLADAIKAEVLA